MDLQISVADLDLLDAFRGPMEGLGYVFRADNADRTKGYVREPPGTPRTHVHVRRSGSPAERSALLFRDHLRSHPNEAARYGDLKRALAARHRHDRRAYTDAKAPFIQEAMERADRWTQVVGWAPGPSDA